MSIFSKVTLGKTSQRKILLLLLEIEHNEKPETARKSNQIKWRCGHRIPFMNDLATFTVTFAVSFT